MPTPPPSPLMNGTKWDELRMGMHALGRLRPQWRTRDLATGFESVWDGDWYYHFRLGACGPPRPPPPRPRTQPRQPASSPVIAIAATVPSDTAVVIWRKRLLRTSPAAYTPSRLVRISGSTRT